MDTFLFENKLQLLQKTSPLIACICLLEVFFHSVGKRLCISLQEMVQQGFQTGYGKSRPHSIQDFEPVDVLHFPVKKMEEIFPGFRLYLLKQQTDDSVSGCIDPVIPYLPCLEEIDDGPGVIDLIFSKMIPVIPKVSVLPNRLGRVSRVTALCPSINCRIKSVLSTK